MANFTKPAIRAAFRELLQERPLNKITVKDVVERCGVNRNTFYYHYDDLPALLEELIRTAMDELLALYPNPGSAGDCLRAAMDYMTENRRMVMHIYNSPNSEMYMQYLRRACADVVHRCFDSLVGNIPIDAQSREAAEFGIRCLCMGVLDEWLAGGMKDSTTQTAQRLMDIISALTENYLCSLHPGSKIE